MPSYIGYANPNTDETRTVEICLSPDSWKFIENYAELMGIDDDLDSMLSYWLYMRVLSLSDEDMITKLRKRREELAKLAKEREPKPSVAVTLQLDIEGEKDDKNKTT